MTNWTDVSRQELWFNFASAPMEQPPWGDLIERNERSKEPLEQLKFLPGPRCRIPDR